jgi:hypothetical protein
MLIARRQFLLFKKFVRVSRGKREMVCSIQPDFRGLGGRELDTMTPVLARALFVTSPM